jgi:FtsP/CotA-like multicopper oxidase with cupredoxin domain
MLTRRRFLAVSAAGGAALALAPVAGRRRVLGAHGATPPAVAGIEPHHIPRFGWPLVIPPQMPRTAKLKVRGGKNVDYYEIAVRPLTQHVLPPSMGLEPTPVWGYGSVNHPGTFNFPSFTIEARWQAPTRVKWINGLVDAAGNYLPHLLPIDQTLHWANPPGGTDHRDHHGHMPEPYTGPVPMVTHVHGAHTHEESDGYAEAWYLPAATDIPDGYARFGTWYDAFNTGFQARTGGPAWEPGTATFQYPNDQRATTLWYHDHTLGMTRANVYAGPAGFFLLRGGPEDAVFDARTGRPAVLPGPAPIVGANPFGTYYEIPIAVQDRSFTAEGRLFYPDNRAFFEGLEPDQLQIPFIPDEACDGAMSDISPIWNPEFFGTTIVVNGRTWPYLDVERRRYRFRLLNGCNSRFLVLQFEDPRVKAWQIGAEGGFLPAPVLLNDAPPDDVPDGTAKLLMGPAERADVIVDFAGVPDGTSVRILNLGPDEPFGGFAGMAPANPETTGQVMELRVRAATGRDPSTPPQHLVLPAAPPVVTAPVRNLSLNEADSATVRVTVTDEGVVMLACGEDGEPFGPAMALLGTLDGDGLAVPQKWMDGITENPAVGATETWAFYNFTADAHPIHIHQVQFRVVDRQALVTDEAGMATQPAIIVDGTVRGPEPWETGFKDTVIAYPGEVTRVQATFDLAGLYVWHCHIVEHEDNEMMRPFRVGDGG